MGYSAARAEEARPAPASATSSFFTMNDLRASKKNDSRYYNTRKSQRHGDGSRKCSACRTPGPARREPRPASGPEPSFLLFLAFGRLPGERKGREHVARLVLHLILHLDEQPAALLDVVVHHVLQGRGLHAHQLGPGFGAEMLLVQALRLLGHAILDVHQHLDVLFQERAHHTLHGMAVEA